MVVYLVGVVWLCLLFGSLCVCWVVYLVWLGCMVLVQLLGLFWLVVLITFLFGFDIVAVCGLFWAHVLWCFCDLLMGFVLCGFDII